MRTLRVAGALLTCLVIGCSSETTDPQSSSATDLAGIPNKFGIGLSEAGDAVMADRIADLVGPRGWGLITCAEIDGSSQGASGGCINGARELAARNVNVFVRMGPPWHDRKIRNDADPGSNHRRYRNLSAKYRRVAEDLLNVVGGVTLAVQPGNELNLCYEWDASSGVNLSGAEIAAEVASFQRDVGDALSAINDPRLVVVSAPLAPGSVAGCQYRGGGGDHWPICPSNGNCFVPGWTSVDFLNAMTAAVPNLFSTSRWDGFGSHPYPAAGFGHTFFVPHAQASLGLHVYEQELAAVGNPALPVYISETGWSTDAGGHRYSHEQIGDMTVAAYVSSDSNNLGWLRDNRVAAVMPFLLNHSSSWDGFAYLDAARNPRPQFTKVKEERCRHYWSQGCPNPEPPPPTNLPDVTIEQLTLTPAQPEVGDQVRINARVRNIGNASTGQTVGVAYFIGNQYIGFGSRGPMAAQTSSSDFNINVPWTAVEGTHELRAVVDDVDRFRELDENNNSRTMTIRVNGAAPPPPPPNTGVEWIECVANSCAVEFTTDLSNGQRLGEVPRGTVMGVFTRSGDRRVVSWPMADRGFAVQYVDVVPGVWASGTSQGMPGSPPQNGAAEFIHCASNGGCEIRYSRDIRVAGDVLGAVPCGRRMGVFVKDSRAGVGRYVVSYPMSDRDYAVQTAPIDASKWSVSAPNCGGNPPPQGNLLTNGDFASDTNGWSQWTQRGTMSLEGTGGRARISGNDVNGGIYQTFTTQPGDTIEVSGHWRTEPSAPQSLWAEVLVMHGAAPQNGQDVAPGGRVELLFKNDTWATTGGWNGTLISSSPVAQTSTFVAREGTTTLVIKHGNSGGQVTGLSVDDLVVEVTTGSPPPPPPTQAPQIGAPPANGCPNSYDFSEVRAWASSQGRQLGLPKFGFHVGPGGNARGLGDMMRCLDAAGIPFFLKSADAAGAIWEAQELRRRSGVPHVLVYRKSGNGWDVPNYFTSPQQAALDHWNAHRDQFPPELDPNLVWLETINEIDKDRSDWLGYFAQETATLAMRDGFKWSAFGWSSGEPERHHWELPGMLGFLQIAGANPDRISVALHEYSYTNSSLDHEFPFKVGRFQALFDVADQHGIPRPTVLITEFGWEYASVPGVTAAMQHLQWAHDLYAPHPQILGAAIWYLGPGFLGVANETQRLIAPVTQFSLQNYTLY